MTTKTERVCVICGGSLDDGSSWKHGHNPAPVTDKGRACSDCNTTVVIPVRIARMRLWEREQQKQEEQDGAA